MTRLLSSSPAGEWVEGYPLGNGRLGVMCLGAALSPHFQINDGTAWSGSPRNEAAFAVPTPQEASELLAESRRRLAAGDPEGAEQLLRREQTGWTQAYQPFIDLRLSVSGTASTGYQRQLDLASALCSVTADGLLQEAFVSAPHGVFVVRLTSEAPVDVVAELSTQHRVLATENRRLELRLPSDVPPAHEPAEPVRWSAEPGSALEGAAVLDWQHDGTDEVREGLPVAVGVRRLTLVLATRTTFQGLGREPEGTARRAGDAAAQTVASALAEGWDALLAAHTADHRALFDRVVLTLGPQRSVDTGERLGAVYAEGIAADPALAALLFDLGRYLLITSSRPGGLPTTLQGLWNAESQPPWSSNYTTNINLPMNYWPAEVVDLPETLEPYLELVDALAVRGRATAEALYGARGWVTHHNTDAWAHTTAVGAGRGDASWAFWPMAAPWLLAVHRRHLEFGGDDAFAERARPALRGAAQFLLDWLIESPDGSLQTSPSTSPENRYLLEGRPVSLTTSSALDLALTKELLTTVVAVDERCRTVDDLTSAARAALSRIPSAPLIHEGRLLEWGKDVEEEDPRHRHVSPLYSIFPGDEVPGPVLVEAATAMLERRGDDSTGWSLVWKAAIWARLGRADRIQDLLPLVFRRATSDAGPWHGGLHSNLFCSHPPFQIDGNLGFTAAVAEMLLQSHAGVIDLLPALPPAFPEGGVHGLIARPGVSVSMTWAGGVLVSAALRCHRPSAAGPHTIRYRERVLVVAVPSEGEVSVDVDALRAP
ncbi:glycoside hydrolase family 95 protein [Rathayibacter sp. ZW T2_19]|uniref:Glycoside hydrolase family 95 protein n=1 Tax=Rathayibacter rubneri TaxID=2950106 RepID=A0A9X2DX49_9MICO|nr:glycoside hydrolase N-terminal domain-containing protein [Rathayibacter rubneri]MCM6761208.1 glycoside hydrolase family 95 protein [Rathayibacter rubneri]